MNDLRDRTLFGLLLIVFGIVLLLTAARVACGGDELRAAQERLRDIESERQHAADVRAAKSTHDASEPITPTPDPISTRHEPQITFSQAVSAAPERLPRGILVVGQYCSPCLRIERECADLIGGPDAPIQLVRNWLANDLEKWGVTPGMQISTPVIFILDRDGKVHGLTAGGLGCVLRGYHSREAILDYLALSDHGVSIDREKPPPVLATVEHADTSPATFAAVLAAHLAESSGQQQTDEQYLYGGLFDFSVDISESWRQIGLKILTAQQIEFPTAGLTVDWSGPKRSFNVTQDTVAISPPVRVHLKKWRLSYSAALDGMQFSSDLSAVTVLLTGAPDITIHLR